MLNEFRDVPPHKVPETDHELLAQIRDELRTQSPRVEVRAPS